MPDLWYKDAVIYCLDVETFQDSNGDGIGDFRGLTERLDHLVRLGVTCVWLLPFYPTPNRDNGYDVVDYYGVDPRLGTLGDFVEFMRGARERGLRVIIDLVVNHTSDQHPWFQAARQGPESPFHDWYVWKDERPDGAEDDVIFPGVQETTWTYDRKARRYYFHRFYEHQPDLNISNEEVRDAIRRIMGFWLELGVSGFRLDAAPFLIELKGIDGGEATDPLNYLKEFRAFLSWRRGDAILLAEANVPADRIDEYFGHDQRLHMLFNFLLNQQLFLALARGEATPLIEGVYRPERPPPEGQWANFLRNHDELDLGRLTDAQRREVFQVFAPDEDMRLYERGIRRRLAPMLDNDSARLRLANSLCLTLPGTPVIRYGQEIGMGDDLSLEERSAVRTAMQWTDSPNGGFSRAKPDALARPVIRKGEYGFPKVNVEAQRRAPDSLLQWLEHAIQVRRQNKEFGRGIWEVHDTDDVAVFCHSCTDEGRSVVAIHNLADREVEVRVDLSSLEGERLRPLLDPGDDVDLDDGTCSIRLDRYGFRWFRIAE